MDSDLISVVAYARVSTDDKGQDVNVQLTHIRNWAKAKGYNIVKEYSEEISGTIIDRPKLMECISYCKIHHIPILVAYDPSRITRADNIQDYKDMLNPTKLYFSSSEIDPDSLGGQIHTFIQSKMDKRENDIRREKIKLGMNQNKINNIHNGRPSAFEFITSDNQKFPDGKIIAQEQIGRGGKVKRATILITPNQFLEYADKGIAITAVAEQIFKVSRNVVIRKAKELGIYEEYHERFMRARGL